MFKWAQSFFKATTETKFFALNWFIYSLMLVLTTLYAYGRLDFVRTHKAPPPQMLEQEAPSKNP